MLSSNQTQMTCSSFLVLIKIDKKSFTTLDYDLPTVIIEGDNSAKNDTVVNDGSTTVAREDNDNSNDNRRKAFNAKVEDYKMVCHYQ
ncbi:unnamed protein product [Didymodactylos carnosus]|uniref:Uncharacterized protein n=1 Tax=Didymodactylos carnosus TaxID=1234261 RepID=A0A8S2G4T7_9BILA|nr:unnamed protein product [Didymodactylos carnosus]CAF4411821.1 unnamed protein product [Didymodactylos carnosus]